MQVVGPQVGLYEAHINLPAATTPESRYLPPPASPFEAIQWGGGTIARVLTVSLVGTSAAVTGMSLFQFRIERRHTFEHNTLSSLCVQVSSCFSAFWAHHISYSDCFGNYNCDLKGWSPVWLRLSLSSFYTYTRITCRYGLDKIINQTITTSETHQ